MHRGTLLILCYSLQLIFDRGVQFQDIMIFYTVFCLVMIPLGTLVMIPAYKTLLRWSDEERQMYGKDTGENKDVDFMHKSLDASYNSSNKK